ncbi:MULTISPECIES: fluoride efflux transporter CrcB [Pseudomonas]|uniref:Fluoride-specific ion channel FluC n=1 Tax=Pseudomonas spirodelae TaxID=3101751 RepID=A0ABU5P9Z7_9PSED|nr:MULTISPECIES: fluoride efflux transporter CrcB [unclassified Pseudomonas]MBU0903087.1 fluoride efflux transporter CrcB [Gammaproteobacteria bacterium]MDD2162117.1 fluoride efflux transporter CrcB [Pseudomonas sp. MIL19]MEA1606487.1 fluoride efflux transporter CrcB [Pseudomonas sp. T5W1]
MIRVALAVALGGAVGSVLRFLTASWVAAQWPRYFYIGTFTVNILGCLLIGLLSGLLLLRSDLPIELRSGLIIGLLGGFTTFSSFSLELLKLFESGRHNEAFAYLLCSVLGGVTAVWGGFSLARLYQ